MATFYALLVTAVFRDDFRFMIAGLPAFVFAGVYSLRLRCPRCRRKMFLRTFTVGDISVPYTPPTVLRWCPHCRLDLRTVCMLKPRSVARGLGSGNP
jgi:hypothetical protein